MAPEIRGTRAENLHHEHGRTRQAGMSNLRKEWISDLSAADADVRAAAARNVYAAGRVLADPVVSAWCRNEEFARLVGAPPQVTIGLAVRPETFSRIREANDWPRLAEIPATQDASEFTLHFPGVALDILTSRDPGGSGAIAKFLSKLGEGLQQVEYRCADVDRATVILEQHLAVFPVYPKTMPGADGTRINFFLIAMPCGKRVLIELYEEGEH